MVGELCIVVSGLLSPLLSTLCPVLVIKLLDLCLDIAVLSVRVEGFGVHGPDDLLKLLLIDFHQIWLVSLGSGQLLAVTVEVLTQHCQLEVVWVVAQFLIEIDGHF